MLFESLLLGVLILLPCTISTIGMGKDLNKLWQKIVLIFGPYVDAFLVFWICTWLDLSGPATWGASLSMGWISHALIQPMLCPRRLIVWRLAMQQVFRRKRQTALMMAGLMITSAIITSSLVVGDSLDATIKDDIELAYDNTDLSVYSRDKRSGVLSPLGENLTNSITQSFLEHPEVKAVMKGIDSSATLTGPDGLAEPLVPWFAYEGDEAWSRIGGESGYRFGEIGSGILINEVLSAKINATKGDTVNMSFYITDEDGDRERKESTLLVFDVVKNDGLGAMGGAQSSGIYSTLDTSQRLLEMTDEVNRLRVSLHNPQNAEQTSEQLLEAIDKYLQFEDVGLRIESEGDMLSLLSQQGLGRLSASFMDSFRENASNFAAEDITEVLQIPLIEVLMDYEQILALPDSELNFVLPTDAGDWYISSGGVSYQIDRGGDVVNWVVPEGGIINDFAMLEGGLLVAHDSGLHYIPKQYQSPVEEIASGNMLAVINETMYFDNNAPPNWIDQIPSPIFSVQMEQVENGTWYLFEGLFERTLAQIDTKNDLFLWTTNATKMILDNQTLLLGNSDAWWKLGEEPTQFGITHENGLLQSNSDWSKRIDTGWISLIPPPESCTNGPYAFQKETWFCGVNGGIMLAQGDERSLRIPILADVGGFGIMPQLLMAFDGNQSPPEGEIHVSPILNQYIDNESIWLKGLIPTAYGDDDWTILKTTNTIESIDAPGLEALNTLLLGFINLSNGETLAYAEDGERSLVILQGADREELESWLNQMADHEMFGLKAKAIKIEAYASAEEGAGILSAMFLVFGTFTIVAGILLVITIIIMLADERRSESGITRSLGFKRSDLRALAVFEGLLTSCFAAILGGVIGLFLALVISDAFSEIFSSVGASRLDFAASLNSIIDGASYGFLLSMSVLLGVSYWTSRLNIVAAVRGFQPMDVKGVSWVSLLILIACFGAASLGGLILLVTGKEDSTFLPLWHMTAALGIIGICTLFFNVVPSFIPTRVKGVDMLRRNKHSITCATIGFSLFAWALLPDWIDPVRAQIQPNEVTFALLGIVQVFAGVMILVGFAPFMAGWLGKRKIFLKTLGPVVPVALAHPARSPLRTAVLMGMFSITVFSVVVLAGYASQFESHSSGFVDEASGDFEILLSSSRQSPLDLSSNPAEWPLQLTNASDIDAVGQVQRATVWIENANESRIGYVLRGFDVGFAQHGGLPLSEWDNRYGSTEHEVWQNVSSRPDLVLVDASFLLIDPLSGEALSGLKISIGESISLIDVSNAGKRQNVVVAGVLSESSNLFSSGIWLNATTSENFGGSLTRVYVSHGEGVDAKQLSENLNRDLASTGVSVTLIEEEILEIQSLVFAILSIFQSYLSLGLFVGIAGMGVVTVRSVSERRAQIGIMRALGFRKSMILQSFWIEVTWIGMLGIVNGVLVGVGFHNAIHEEFWKEQGVELILPWTTIWLVLLGGWLMLILATYWPVRRASLVSPAEALRVDAS